MATRSKSSYKGYKDSQLPTNGSGSITAAAVRLLHEDLADSVLFITDHLLDEDNMASDSATQVPSQQSVKAYVDASAGVGSSTFTGLTDTPANFTGSGGFLVRVNATPDALEFVDGTTLFASTSHNHTLDSLSNVTITANTSGEILKWNGSAWINNTLAEAGIQAAGTYVTSVTGGTGISSTGGTTPSLALTVDELAEKTGAVVGTDRLVGTSGTTNFAETISGIPLSIFNNDAGWTSNTGTILGSVATNIGLIPFSTGAANTITSSSDLTYDGTELFVSKAYSTSTIGISLFRARAAKTASTNRNGGISYYDDNSTQKYFSYGYDENDAGLSWAHFGYSITNSRGFVRLDYSGSPSPSAFHLEDGKVGIRIGLGSYAIHLKADTTTASVKQISMQANGSTTELWYVTADGTNTGLDFVATSDKRLKENITQFTVLESIRKMGGMLSRYNWIGKADVEIGMMAQDVLPIFPELVSYDKAQDRYGLKYSKIGAIALQGLVEVDDEVTKLKKRLSELEDKVKRLSAA